MAHYEHGEDGSHEIVYRAIPTASTMVASFGPLWFQNAGLARNGMKIGDKR